jgi:hypothetical protein
MVLPSGHGSTLQEIEWLVSNDQLRKCIFVMPETMDGQGVSVGLPEISLARHEIRYLDHARGWEQARQALKDQIALPVYDARGALFMMGLEGAPMKLRYLELSRSVLRVRKLRQLLQEFIPGT